MTELPFTKMHGLGNDFVILDVRRQPLELSAAQARTIADRHTGVGCDQLILMEPPRNGRADVFMRIYNTDGSESAVCGNATRCIAALIMAEGGRSSATVETVAGLLEAGTTADGNIVADMGRARFDWHDIPLAEARDTLHLGIEVGPLKDPVAVSMGNPHAVFFVEDAEAIPLEACGPAVERHPLFPEATNVEVAQVLARDTIRLRVWERGTGVTQACGSGACATLVAANRRGLSDRTAEVVVDGGRLGVAWLDNGHIRMTGPVAIAFTGTIDESLLG